MIKVRFAPSPTGNLHIGGARTALFNWMYAKSQEGKFILRIEDTDRERSKQEFVDEILNSLKWLNFSWDELYFQSKRFDIYREHAQRLLDEGKAFKEGDAVILKMSANPAQGGIDPASPKASAEASETSSSCQRRDDGPHQTVKWDDLIRGEIIFDTATIKDQVLMKSDGAPTYSFACVVDDALMEISHVIRGEDHISNTPKQIVIYQALGFKMPKFAHLPLIMGEEGRLSKRTGAVAVSEYRKMGFLPEAIVNYLMLLGWSPGGNQEVVDFQSAIKRFSIKKVNKTAAEFSIDKLTWINSQYIKKMDTDKLVELLVPFLREKGYINQDSNRKDLKNIVKLFQGRIETLTDFLRWAEFIFKEVFSVDEEAKKKITPEAMKQFGALAEALEKIEPFASAAIEESFRNFAKTKGIETAGLVHPVRAVLTGKTVGPGLFETMALLGREKTVKRLAEAAKSLKA